MPPLLTWEETVSRYKEAYELSDERFKDSRVEFYRSLWLYARLIPQAKLLLEIGTLYGDSAFFLASAIVGTNAKLICVDPVLKTGTYTFREWNDEEISFSVDPSLVRERILKSGIHESQLELVPEKSWDYIKKWQGSKIDLLLVDGCHTFEAVHQDCEWLQHVSVYGYAVFDDWMACVAGAVFLYLNQCSHGNWRVMHCSTEEPVGEWRTTLLRRIG